MQFRDSFPEVNKLSIVSAVIMLAFALTQLISFPARLLSFTLFGVLIEFTLDFNTIITGLTAVLAAAGMQWLILSHPMRDQQSSQWLHARHWILPILTSIVIGVALNTFTGSSFWWVTFILGSVLLIAVLIAEYNVLKGEQENHPIARIGLSSLSFALYLLLAIAVYAANLRLYIRLPLLAIGAMMVVSRTLFLRLKKWETIWSIVITLIISEIAVGFHYLPLTPSQFGLLLIGLAYGLTSLVTGIKESRIGFAFWGESVVVMTLMVIISVLWP